MFRTAIVAAAVVAVATAGRVCNSPDCSDVVHHALVKDNLGTAQHFNERHHDEREEEHRVRRIEILRREKPSQ